MNKSSERTKVISGNAELISMELKLGETLSSILKERRLGLREVSTATKIPVSTLSEWTSNRPSRDPAKLKLLSKYLGISLHYLLFGCEDDETVIAQILREELFTGSFEITVKRLKLPKGNK